MASLPNLAKDAVKRLKNDASSIITLLFTRDNAPVDISGRQFVISFCTSGKTDEQLAVVEGSSLVRPQGTIHQLDIDLSEAEREALTENSYSVYVQELVDGARKRRKNRFLFTYELLDQPDPYSPTLPDEPASLQINYSSLTSTSSLSLVYQVGGAAPGAVPGAASEAQAANLSLPVGAAGLVLIINEKPFIRIGAKLYGLALTDTDI